MSPEETARLLASAATRRLSPEAEQRILSAVVASSSAPSVNWWLRRVPLWQAAAACLVVCLATLGVIRALTENRSTAPDPLRTRSVSTGVEDVGNGRAELVRVDKAIFGAPAPPVYRVDIAKWQFQTSMTE